MTGVVDNLCIISLLGYRYALIREPAAELAGASRSVDDDVRFVHRFFVCAFSIGQLNACGDEVLRIFWVGHCDDLSHILGVFDLHVGMALDVASDYRFHRGASAHQYPHFFVTGLRLILVFECIWDGIGKGDLACTGAKEVY